MAFPNTLLEQILEMPYLSEHWLYNFNTLGDKNESVSETTKIGSTQTTALPTPPTTTPLTPCTSAIKDIETLINKVDDFPILWDKSCAEYKNALKKKNSLGEHSKRNNLEVEGREFKNSCISPNVFLKNNCTHSNLTFTQS